MSLDLDDLVAEPELYVRSATEKSDVGGGTVVAYRDKDEVLAELESEIEAGDAVALKASYEENVSEWVGAIREYVEKAEGAVSFSEWVARVRLPVMVVWIGFLLGGFRLEQDGEFYDGAIWVRW
jgi:hypothetical protein